MKRARGAARGVVIQVATFLLFGVVAGIVPARNQAIAGPSDSGRQVAAQLGRTSGVQRYRILYDLKSANRIATGLTVADLNAIISAMEDQRTRVISLMARELVANLSAADVVALSGQTSSTSHRQSVDVRQLELPQHHIGVLPPSVHQWLQRIHGRANKRRCRKAAVPIDGPEC